MPSAFESVVHIDAEMLRGLAKDNEREARYLSWVNRWNRSSAQS